LEAVTETNCCIYTWAQAGKLYKFRAFRCTCTNCVETKTFVYRVRQKKVAL